MRDEFSNKIVEQVSKNNSTYILSGDHGYALFDKIRKEKPSHFINAGIAEQNMVGVAAGLAKQGLYPIIYGLSAFVPIRVLEQIKLDFCYSELPGLFIGDGAGVVYAQLGASHQSTEDIAVMRSIANCAVLSPADAFEFESCFDWAVLQKFPIYLRMGKCDLGSVHQKNVQFDKLKNGLCVVDKGSKNAIFATGSMVKICSNLIEKFEIDVNLYSCPVLKVQGEFLNFFNQSFDKIITVEEHSIMGGLGDIVLNQINDFELKTKLLKIGIDDKFSKKCGSYDFALKEHGLDNESLLNKINKFLNHV